MQTTVLSLATIFTVAGCSVPADNENTDTEEEAVVAGAVTSDGAVVFHEDADPVTLDRLLIATHGRFYVRDGENVVEMFKPDALRRSVEDGEILELLADDGTDEVFKVGWLEVTTTDVVPAPVPEDALVPDDGLTGQGSFCTPGQYRGACVSKASSKKYHHYLLYYNVGHSSRRYARRYQFSTKTRGSRLSCPVGCSY